MARKLAAVMILLLALALGAGCAAPGSSGGSQATPGQGGAQTQPQGDFSPGPVVTVPPGYEVEIQVNKNMISTNPTIDVFYRGGKGQLFLQRMFVELQRSDGKYMSGQLLRSEGGQIAVGEKVSFMGTTGTDRVVVTVTIPALGREFKIYDKNLEFKTRP